MKALIVAPNISTRMGGEAVLPVHCIRELARAGIEVSALTHARVRDELKASDLWEDGRFHFIEDATSERMLYRLGKRVPGALREAVFESTITTITLARLAARARDLARETGADIIHQPAPVSPRLPSFLTRMPAPVIIGPSPATSLTRRRSGAHIRRPPRRWSVSAGGSRMRPTR